MRPWLYQGGNQGSATTGATIKIKTAFTSAVIGVVQNRGSSKKINQWFPKLRTMTDCAGVPQEIIDEFV